MKFNLSPFVSLGRITNEIIDREVNYQMIKPKFALFYLTYRCTSQCKSCNTWRLGESSSTEHELKENQWKSIIDQLAESNVKTIEFFGGDVFLRSALLVELIHHAKLKNINTYLPTNGNLLNREIASKLVNAGLDYIYFSVDGVGADQDFVRGVSGTFEKVSAAILNVIQTRGKSKSPVIIINTTISALNADGFEHIVPWAEKIGADSVHLNYAADISETSIRKSSINGILPTPFYSSLDEPILLTDEQSSEVKEKLKQLKKAVNQIKIESSFVDMLTSNDLSRGIFPTKKCYISRTKVTIDPYGNVLPCAFYRKYQHGNLIENKFDTIWRNNRHLMFVRRQSSNKLDICKHCNMNFYKLSPLKTLQKKYQARFGLAKR